MLSIRIVALTAEEANEPPATQQGAEDGTEEVAASPAVAP